ncbi:MAG: prepilin peptidase [Beijerinckiaceae bacterium]|nr:prepilin peptidase [Beijerinckiaceae bacterium]
MDDLRNYRIRNEAVAALVVLYLLKIILLGQFAEASYHAIFAALMFLGLLAAYARGLLGGGDVKLLGAAFLWLGLDSSLLFSLFLIAFTLMYAALAKLGAVPKRMVAEKTKIPFGPCIGSAWIATVLAGGA